MYDMGTKIQQISNSTWNINMIYKKKSVLYIYHVIFFCVDFRLLQIWDAFLSSKVKVLTLNDTAVGVGVT